MDYTFYITEVMLFFSCDNDFLIMSENILIQHKVYSQYQKHGRFFIPLTSFMNQDADEVRIWEAQLSTMLNS